MVTGLPLASEVEDFKEVYILSGTVYKKYTMIKGKWYKETDGTNQIQLEEN